MTYNNEYISEPLFQSAALCGPQGDMTMPMLETQLIVAATRHANQIGVGYDDLLKQNAGWVLVRMSIEATRTPRINETYRVVTWIEGFNRHLSERNFAVLDADGNPMAYGRSVWACIDITRRRPVAINPVDCFGDRPCPIAPQPRLVTPGEDAKVITKQFTFSDLDFNRHVNSARYTERLLDCFPLAYHDANRLQRLDIAYVAETQADVPCDFRISEQGEGVFDTEISVDGRAHCRARLTFVPR